MKKYNKKLVMVFVLLLGAANIFAAVFKANDTAYVKVLDLAVKVKPGTYAKTVKTIDYGTKVTVSGVKNTWVQITVNGEKLGWVPETSLSARKVASTKTSVNAKEIALAGRGAKDGIEKAFSEFYDEHFEEVDIVEGYAAKEREVLQFIVDGELNGGDE